MAGNNDLRIKIVAKLDETLSTKQLQSQLDKIASKLKLNVNIDTKQIKEVSNAIKSLQNQASQKNKGNSVVNDKDVSKVKEIYTTLNDAVNKYKQLGSVKVDKSINPINKEIEKFQLTVTKANGEVEKLKFKLNSLQGAHGVGGFGLYDRKITSNSDALAEKQLQQTQKINRRIEQEQQKLTTNIKQEQEKLIQGFQRLFDQGKIGQGTFNKFNNAINSSKNLKELEKMQQKLQMVTNSANNKALQQKLIGDAQTLLRTHSKTVDTAGVNRLVSDLNRIPVSARNASNSLTQAQVQLRNFQQSSREAARSSMTVLDAFRTAMVKFCRL